MIHLARTSYLLESLLSCQLLLWLTSDNTTSCSLFPGPSSCGSESCLDDVGSAQTTTSADSFSGLLASSAWSWVHAIWYLVQTCISSSLAPHSVNRLKPWPKILSFPCWKLPCTLSALFGQVCAQVSHTRNCLLSEFLLDSSTVCIPTCLLLFADSCCPVL